MKTSVETSKNEIKSEMSAEIKGNLRSVAIGLSGLIIITLAIFKVIDLKISSTRNIKKYEKLMQQKTQELNQLILQAQQERSELNNARYQLAEYQKRLMNYNTLPPQQPRFGTQSPFQPQQQFNVPYPPIIPSPPETKKSGFKSFIIFLLFIIILGMVGYMIFDYFVLQK